MSSETAVMRELQIEASRLGARLFRQNTGMAWVGNARRIARSMTVKVDAGDVVIKAARPFHAGIAGMSDLGGWVPVVVAPEMVGSTLAVYAQVEVKDGGRATAEQLRWIAAVKKAGGLAGIARNAADLRSILTSKVVSRE